MLVFDDIERPDKDTHPHDEPDFVYTNRSGRDVAKKVRALIEEMLTRYPEAERAGLVQRLRSSIDVHHRSAFFELLLHDLFTKHSHKVIAVEPDVPGTSAQPDFLLETPRGERYYLEAVFARGQTDAQVGAEKRLNSAIQAIDSTPSPNHFLDMRTKGFPAEPVPINKLRRAVAEWIGTLPDGDAARTSVPFKYKYGGMEIMLTAFPKFRKGVTRTIGVRHFGARRATRAEGMKDAVEHKARKYGKQLAHPLLVAVAGYDQFNFDDDAIHALLGTEVGTAHKDVEGKTVIGVGRSADGVWHDATGPRRRVLSGVLWFKQIDPWNFAARTPLIVANPWADKPMPRLNIGLRELHIGAETEYPGDALGKAIGLEDNWPESPSPAAAAALTSE